MNKEPNEVYDEIQKTTDKFSEIREHANDIANYAKKEPAFCSFVRCPDCPMNIGREELICIANMEIIR